MFADDVLIFLNGRRESIKNMMEFLIKCQVVAGQKISASKSCFLASKKMAAWRLSMISKVTGFSKGSLPFTYLGCTIFKGRTKQIYFKDLVMKI